MQEVYIGIGLAIISLGFALFYYFSEERVMKFMMKYMFLIIVMSSLFELSFVNSDSSLAYLAWGTIAFIVINIVVDFLDILIGFIGVAFFRKSWKVKK